MQETDGRVQARGAQRRNCFSSEDRVPVGQGGVHDVLRWLPGPSVEGQPVGHQRPERTEVGAGRGTLHTHQLLHGAGVGKHRQQL